MKKLISVYKDDRFFMATLRIPQAAPSKPIPLLLAGTWGAYGGYHLTLSLPIFTVSYHIKWVYRGMVDYWLSRMRKQLNRFLMGLRRTPVYAEWSAYYRVDHVSRSGARCFPNGKAALEWARSHDEDYDSEVSFGYRWCDEGTYLSYRGEDRGRDYLMEAHEDGHPHCVYG